MSISNRDSSDRLPSVRPTPGPSLSATGRAGGLIAGCGVVAVAATAALDRFVAFNTEIVALSRRNTNVRSLAMTLGQKRALTAACDEALRALQAALAKRGFSATR